MAEQRDRDDLDRDRPMTDEDTRAIGEEEFEDTDEADEESEDEDDLVDTERITGEVGSEGGSPGENVRTPRRS
jgi:hypothetical protein